MYFKLLQITETLAFILTVWAPIHSRMCNNTFVMLKLKWSCNPCLSYELGLHMCWSWQMEMSSFGDVNQEIVKFCYLVYEEKKYMAFSLCEEMYSMSPYIVVTASSEHTVIKLWQQSSK